MEILRFTPLLKQALWGGDKIIPFKHLDSRLAQVGESWELSGVDGSETVVCEGQYKGRTLNSIVKEKKAELVGQDNYQRFGDVFPLLVKFIDARTQLSIQVHPSDEYARSKGERCGKTEMWYVMKSDADAKLRSGLRRSITPEEYKQMVEDGTIVDAVAEYSVKEGDCFHIPAGRIHSIEAGCFLAEIQQTSDITYRIYDFKRKDKNGNYRQLHTKEASECIDYRVSDNYLTEYTPQKNIGVTLVQCPYFYTAVYDLTEPMTIDYSELDSFVILVCVGGSAEVTDHDGNTLTLRAGETILVPATMRSLRIEGTVKFIEAYV